MNTQTWTSILNGVVSVISVMFVLAVLMSHISTRVGRYADAVLRWSLPTAWMLVAVGICVRDLSADFSLDTVLGGVLMVAVAALSAKIWVGNRRPEKRLSQASASAPQPR